MKQRLPAFRLALVLAPLFLLIGHGRPAECADGDRCGRACYGDGEGWCPATCQCLQTEPGVGVCVRIEKPEGEN